MSARYLTTTLPYVNADPHIGFALEVVQADTLVRAWRAAGNEVFFLTGTDEHGQKIYEASKKAKKEVQEYVDHYAAEFRKLKDLLNLSNDAFVRTTDGGHIQAVQELWRRCDAAGDIYKKAYTGLYCVGCELFKTERDIVDGKCPIHPNLELRKVTEENYFFRFSKYTETLLAYLARGNSVIPDWRREEAMNFVKGGLSDFSISREKSRLPWGIPVPGDDGQVVYVWFDGLAGYISPLGWPADQNGEFQKFWQEGVTYQVAGKDQVRFQSLMWQAMLTSAGLKNTDVIFYHGFINSGGQKMSKSLGNVINPYDLVQKYGTDATRYLLLRHVHPTEDSDVTWERLDEWYTANLANGLGNLVARVMKLAQDYIGSIPVDVGISKPQTQINDFVNRFEFNSAINVIWDFIQLLDEKMNAEEPFKLIKIDLEKGRKSILELRSGLFHIGYWLKPFMPDTSKKILDAVQENKKPESLFPRLA